MKDVTGLRSNLSKKIAETPPIMKIEPTDTELGDAPTNSIYSELPSSVGDYKYGGGLYTDAQMRDFADRTHALRMEQAAPKASPATQQAGEKCPSCRNGDLYACTCPFPTSRNATTAQVAPACQHRIADARNPVVKSGYICVDCGALFSAADHKEAAPAAQGDAEDAATSFDLPPLPDPDLRDVGTKPQEIKEFLKGYATEYARTAITARAQAKEGGSHE